jgi:hypothetical protein
LCESVLPTDEQPVIYHQMIKVIDVHFDIIAGFEDDGENQALVVIVHI